METDFNDLLLLFNKFDVRYLIVGGYAYARYAEPRATKDLDLFIQPEPANGRRAYNALAMFGASLGDMTAEDFAHPGKIFQIGVPPLRIDVINKIDGLTFDETWDASEHSHTDDLIPVRYITLDHLIATN